MCYYDNFRIEELLPQEIFKRYGKLGMRYLNPKIPEILSWIREETGVPVYVNTWSLGGDLNERTIRVPAHEYYNPFSDHSYGNAVDFHIKGMTAEDVQYKVLNEWHEEMKVFGVTAIEKDTPTWTHLTVANFSDWEHLEEVNGIKLING